MKKQDEEHKFLRQDAIYTIVIHVILLLLLLFVIWFVVLIRNFFKDVDAILPPLTMLILYLTDFFRCYSIFSIPLVLGLLWLDAKIYSYLYLNLGKSKALLWSLFVIIFIVGAIILCLFGIAMPLEQISKWH